MSDNNNSTKITGKTRLQQATNHTASRPKRRLKRRGDGPVCATCSGSGYESIPDLSKTSMAQIARTAGRSRSFVSRLFSTNQKQKRFNPSLNTMRAMCKAVKEETGQNLTLDSLARAIRGS